MTVFGPSLSSMWRQIADSGLDPEPLFLKHGLESATIFDTNARVPHDAMHRIAAEAVALSGDPFFGLREAEYFLPTHLGSLGFAWLASSSLQIALGRLQRYSKAISDQLEITVTEGSDELIVEFDNSESSPENYHYDTGCLSVLVRMCRFLCGEQWKPLQVSVAYPEPPDTSYYYSFFRCPIQFDGQCNSLHIDKLAASQRIAGADEYLAQLNDHIVTRYLAHHAKTDIMNRVRTAILDTLGDGLTTETAVAALLALSPRQLSRRLKNEGTSFRQLLSECRRELADQYIRDSSLSLTEIAFMLGFSEVSALSRAFKRWTGMSPTEARSSSST